MELPHLEYYLNEKREADVMEDNKVCALIHDLEEASTFGSYGYASNQDYISELLMKAAETILALAQSRRKDKCK